MHKIIPFNKPYFPKKGFTFIKEAISNGKLSGDGLFTKKCHAFFRDAYGFKKVLLTTSCTDALEMSALLAGITPGDEVIIPSYTFPSTANAFVLRGANIVFADSGPEHPNMDVAKLSSLITKKTKAIVPVHYAGVACNMGEIMRLAKENDLFVIEDAAQAIDSYYNKQLLGTVGHLSTFSFHETKNISSGEGGLLAINDEQFAFRSEILWEKGTNRSAFFRGEVNKYGWVDVGSSFLPSDIIAALLFAQLERIQKIQRKRLNIWNQYYKGLSHLSKAGFIKLPIIPSYATNNAHMFYIICRSQPERQSLIEFLKSKGISAIFHYLPLHQSEFYKGKHDGRILPNCEYYSDCLLRLPLYYDLSTNDVSKIIDKITHFFQA